MELKNLKAAQPELASAVDMQIALLEMQRRVQSRVPLPWIQADPEWLRAQYSARRAVVRFADIPLDWTDFRLTLRQTADILRRFETLEQADYESIVALGRLGNQLEPMVISWYEAGGLRPRSGSRASSFSGAVRRGAHAARRAASANLRALPVLRMGAGIFSDYTGSRSSSDLWTLRRSMALRSTVPSAPTSISPVSHRLRREKDVTACTGVTCADSI